jgi:DNA gyrase/topoisomerase IV subunit B
MLLKLKGKILNTSKLDILRASNSNEFVDIIRSITDEDVSGLLKAHKEGRAWNPEFSLGRVILLADADEDGNHITALLIAAFQNYFPQMFERGMIYRVDAPLYYASRGDVKISAYSQPELQEKLSEYKGSSGWIITRAKGWGEISDTLLREIAFDPRTRKLIKLEPMSKKQKAEFESLMGTDSSTRKELLGL